VIALRSDQTIDALSRVGDGEQKSRDNHVRERKKVLDAVFLCAANLGKSSRAQHFAWIAGGDDVLGNVVGYD
jgi:hypothetical protein